MSQQWADYRVFWREFRRSFQYDRGRIAERIGVGGGLESVRPGGLGRRAIRSRRILEVGPGTGAVTRHILAGLRPEDRVDLVELNAEFVACLRERIANDANYRPAAGRIVLHHAGVEELSEAEPYDVIVSGLPLNNFSIELVERMLAKLQRLLAPRGTLSFFEYVAIRRVKATLSRQAERERLQRHRAIARRHLGRA